MRGYKIIPILLLIFSLFIPFLISTASYTDSAGTAYYIPVDDEISFGVSGFLQRGIREAVSKEAALIIIGIDTFGGRVDATLEILKAIETAEGIPVYAFIEDKAWSAGALIALGCSRIFMREGSSIGSAAPLTGEGRDAGEKYVSAIRSKFRATAEKNNYPVNIAAAMVDKSLDVREYTLNGETRYLTPDQAGMYEQEGITLIPGPAISPAGKLLNLSYNEALRHGVASGIFQTPGEMLSNEGLGHLSLKNLDKTWAERLASFLTGSAVSSIMMSLGFIFLFLELEEPGLGLPALIGLSFFALFFFSRHIVHLAEWTDIIIFAVGILLIVIELFILPGFGIAGIGGIILVLLALYLSLSPYTIPRHPWDFETLRGTLLLMMVSLVAGIFGSLALLQNLHRIPGLSSTVLTDTLGGESARETGSEEKEEEGKPEEGRTGTVLSDLRPVGRVRFGDKIHDGISAHGFIAKGEKVRVIEVKENRILVEKET